MPRNKDKMPDANAEMQATCPDTRVRYVRCSTVGLRHLCCRCLSACTIIHGHCGSNDSMAEISVKSLFVMTVRVRVAFSYWLCALCTCLICLYIQPAVCIVTA